MSDNEDDPFAMFGDDESDEEEPAVENEASRIARSLVDLANQRVSISTGESEATPSPPTETTMANSIDVSTFELQDVSAWPDPLYVGPMAVVTSQPFGGGRGCIATRDLSPGTLVLVEEPLATWPPQAIGESFDSLAALEHLLLNPKVTTILAVMEDFHPTKAVVDARQSSSGNGEEDVALAEQVDNMMKTLREEFEGTDQFSRCVELAAKRKNLDGSALSETDILRLLLALRYNALRSGLFVYSAMLNHEDQPSCVKFQPTAEKAYSEVRTTRHVSAGEALTISYLPNKLSHSSRRKFLWEQHRFDIGVNLSADLRMMEIVGKHLPPSNLKKFDKDEGTTRRIEKTIEELEEVYRDIASVAELPSEWNDPAVAEQVKSLEQATLELCTEAERQLQNELHLLLIPCRQLHLDSCDLMQRDPSLKPSQRSLLSGRMVVTAQRLLVLQKTFQKDDHFDLARTYNDLANAIEQQLSRDTRSLIDLGLDGLLSASAWSSLEYRSRVEYRRIKALYPFDVESVIGKSIAHK